MIPLIAAAAGAKIVGDLVGGKKRAKAAKQQQKRAEKAAKEDQKRALALREADMAEAARLAREDEARAQAAHAAAGGYDLAKLRKEAIASGFNPLTVMAMTGAAAYERTAAPTLTTPFIARPFLGRADATIASGQARVETAGYFGDALSAGGSMFVGIAQESARIAAERELANAMREPVRPGAFPQQAVPVDARPRATVSGVPGAAYVPGRGPATYYPQPMGGFATDGLWRADPDTPAEMEADLWGAARGGFVGPFVEDVIRRNAPSTLEAAERLGRDAFWGFMENYPPYQIWNYGRNNLRTGDVQSGRPSYITQERKRRESGQAVPGLGF